MMNPLVVATERRQISVELVSLEELIICAVLITERIFLQFTMSGWSLLSYATKTPKSFKNGRRKFIVDAFNRKYEISMDLNVGF